MKTMQNTIKEKIVEKIDNLSLSQQQELLNYVELLVNKKTNNHLNILSEQLVIPYTFVAHRDPGMSFFKTLSNQKFRWVRINPETYDAPYCCFFAVLQIWRLDYQTCIANKTQHFTESLSPQIKDDIKTGKCKLILDYGNEGIIYNEYLETIFVNLINRLQPEAQGIIFIQQNRVINNSNFAIFKDKRVPQKIRFLHYDYFVKLIIDKISENPAKILDTTMNYPDFATFLKQKTKILLCLNATPRPHRMLIYSYLKQKNYASKCLLSFHGFVKAKGITEKHNFIKVLQQTTLGDLLIKINKNLPLEVIIDQLKPEFIDNKNEHNSNNLADDISNYLYKHSFFSVVTESDYDDDSMKRITEKTIKALAQGHPTIIAGNPHSFELVKDLGFKVFEDIINPEYDLIKEPIERLNIILQTIDKTAIDVYNNHQKFAKKIYENAKYNCEHGAFYLKSKYEEIIENPLLESIRSSLN